LINTSIGPAVEYRWTIFINPSSVSYY